MFTGQKCYHCGFENLSPQMLFLCPNCGHRIVTRDYPGTRPDSPREQHPTLPRKVFVSDRM